MAQAHATVAIDVDSAIVVDCPLGGVSAAQAVLSATQLAVFDVVVTHRDLDHCGGIRDLLDQFANSSTRLFMNAAMAISQDRNDKPLVRSVLEKLFDTADLLGVEQLPLSRGDSGNSGPISWNVLGPTHSQILRSASGGSTNRSSIVIRLQLGSHYFLITGDIDDDGLGSLIDSGLDLGAEVLLAPHHGTRLRRFDDLLDAVKPAFLVVSAGCQRLLPARQTLESATSYGCRILCTGVSKHCHEGQLTSKYCAGPISFELNGPTMTVTPSRQSHGARIAQLASPVCRA